MTQQQTIPHTPICYNIVPRPIYWRVGGWLCLERGADKSFRGQYSTEAYPNIFCNVSLLCKLMPTCAFIHMFSFILLKKIINSIQ